MGHAARATAVEIVLALAGFACLIAAATAGMFEDSSGDFVRAAAPWLLAAGVAWTASARLELAMRPGAPARASARALLLGAVWLSAAILAAGLAGLAGGGTLGWAVWLAGTVVTAGPQTRAGAPT